MHFLILILTSFLQSVVFINNKKYVYSPYTNWILQSHSVLADQGYETKYTKDVIFSQTKRVVRRRMDVDKLMHQIKNKNTPYLKAAINENHQTYLSSVISPNEAAIAISNNLLSGKQWILINKTKVLNNVAVFCENDNVIEKKGKLILNRYIMECPTNTFHFLNYCIHITTKYNQCKYKIASGSRAAFANEMIQKISLNKFKKVGIRKSEETTFVLELNLTQTEFNSPLHKGVAWNLVKYDSSSNVNVRYWVCGRQPQLLLKHCSINTAMCSDQVCLLKSRFCDGITDCPDDENLCHDQFMRFECYYSIDKTAWSNVCDGKADCLDQSDELLCSNEKTSLVVYTLIESTYFSLNTTCPENWSVCGIGSSSCYPNWKMCIYERNFFGNTLYCENNFHLNWCFQYICHTGFKCKNAHCIPYFYVCDGIIDCPQSDDEKQCIEGFSCGHGFLKCQPEDICVSLQDVCDGIIQCYLSHDDEKLCEMFTNCPKSCVCEDLHMACEPEFPKLSNNIPSYIYNNRSKNNRFLQLLRFNVSNSLTVVTKMKSLVTIYFKDCLLSTTIGKYFNQVKHLHFDNSRLLQNHVFSFNNLVNTESISFYKMRINLLRGNFVSNCLSLVQINFIDDTTITLINKNAFQNLPALNMLSLANVHLNNIKEMAFVGLYNLTFLNLSCNVIKRLDSLLFTGMLKLKILDLRHNKLVFISPSAMSHVQTVLLNFNTQCCFVKQVCEIYKVFEPFKCGSLISSISSRITIGILIVVKITMNLSVLKFYLTQKEINTHMFLLSSLSISHLGYVLYFIVLLIQTTIYGEQYSLLMIQWFSSFVCKSIQFLSFFLHCLSQSIMCIMSMSTLRITKYSLQQVPHTQRQINVYMFFSCFFSATIAIFKIVMLNNVSAFCIPTVTANNNDVYSLLLFIVTFLITITPLVVSFAVVTQIAVFLGSTPKLRSTKTLDHSSVKYRYFLSLIGHLLNSRFSLFISDISDFALISESLVACSSTILDSMLFTFTTKSFNEKLKHKYVKHKKYIYGHFGSSLVSLDTTRCRKK